MGKTSLFTATWKPVRKVRLKLFLHGKIFSEGGGWTVLQRRGDYGTAEDYFLRKWEDYKDGFGKPEEVCEAYKLTL